MKKWGNKKRRCLVLVFAFVLSSLISNVSNAAVQTDINLKNNNQMIFDFEKESSEWEMENAEFSTQEHKNGSSSLLLKNGYAMIPVTGIEQGSYTVSMWVKGNAQNAKLTIGETGGPDSVLKIDSAATTDKWTQVSHTNVLVYNGQMEISITNASSGMYIDDIEIVLDAKDENSINNWGFENGLESWNTEGTVEVTENSADTGEKAIRLGDQSELSQIIQVLPDTDYIATVRMKVDRQDIYQSTEQMSLDGKTKMGILVEREELGNRINLGVRGLDGTVLRQAPSSTEGYALVTVSFHTAADQTQVEIYANTIYNQDYVDSVTVYENKDEGNPYPNGYQRPNPEELECTHPSDEWKSNGSEFAYVDNFDVFQINNDYIKGADMSFMQAIEDAGGKYFANGVQQDALRILSNHGVNSILSGIWVHAGNKIYNWSDLTPLETNVTGYDGEEVTGRQVLYNYFDEKHTIALAIRAQELGMTFTPSFHYSDTWISNAKAHIPLEWLKQGSEEKLENPDLAMLETAVYNYVHDFLADMKNAGVNNIIAVKNGNEQDAGLLFPIASGLGSEHASIITSSSRAVKEIYPDVINIIHTNTGYTTDKYNSFFGKLNDAGAEYDGMGFSLYAGRQIYNQHTMMQEVLSDDKLKYYDYINVETAISYTKTPPVGNADSITTSEYDVTPTGQYNYLLNYIQAPLNIPNPYGVMRGFYYWNTEAIPLYGTGHKLGEAAAGTSRTMFNTGVTSIQEMGSAQPGKNGDMLDSMYAYLHRGASKAVSSETYTAINQTVKDYELGDAVRIKIENGEMELKVGERERIHNKVTPDDKVLRDYSVDYTSSNPAVAEVSQYGFVSAVSPGTATITASIGEVSDSVQITVSNSDIAEGMQIDYEVIRNGESVETGKAENNGEIQVLSGDKVRFVADLEGNPTSKELIYTNDNCSAASWYGSTWQTDAEKMYTIAAPVSSKNTVPVVQLNAKNSGNANIKVKTTDAGAEIAFRVSITELKIEGIEIEQGETCSAQIDSTLQLTTKITPVEASVKKVYWKSADEDIATVDQNGLVHAVKAGKTTISVSAEENGAAFDSIQCIVTDIKVEKSLPSSKTIALLKGSEKVLTATVLPEHAGNKEIEWSVKQGGEQVVSVSKDGHIQGISAGEATAIVKSCDGSNVTQECRIIVQEQAVSATGMTLSESELWIDSSYFSPLAEGKEKGKATAKLDAIFEPEQTTNTNVIWTSSNERVATVDINGVVTVHQSGTAQITATAEEGNYEANAMVYVPFISEDWENYKTGSKGGGTDGETFTYKVIEKEGGKALQASVDGKAGSSLSFGKNNSVNHYTFSPVSGKRLIVDFDWNTGTFVSDKNGRGGHISIEDSAGNTWLALAAFPATGNQQYELVYYFKDGSSAFPVLDRNYNYIHGGKFDYSDCVKLEGLMAGKNEEYAVHLELDFESRTISFKITNKDNEKITQTVTDIPMDSQVDYEDDIGGIAFSQLFNGSGSWKTDIDNFSVYSTSVKPESVEYTLDCVNLNPVTGIKLVPVTGALSSTAKISATVLPEEADQNVRFTASGKAAEYINITQDGVITIKEDKQVSYENQSEIGATAEGTIRICVPNAPDVYQDIKFSVGAANTNEKLSIYANDEEFISEALEGKIGEKIALTFKASGGDGTSDLFSYKWEVVSGNAVIENNVLTALSDGTVEVKFTIDFFQGEITKLMKLHFGDVEKETLKVLLEKAENYLKQTEVYTEESLKQLQEEINSAKQVMESEKAVQDDVNQAVVNLQKSIDALSKKVNKSLLENAIKEADTKKQEEYTEETWTLFAKALEEAQKVMNDSKADEVQVEQALSKLMEMMNNLKKPDESKNPVVKHELKAVLDIAAEKVEADYTPLSWEAFCMVFRNAQDVYVDVESTQNEVDQAKAALESAIKNLVLQADFSMLKTLIARAESRKESDYTEETWKSMQEALEQAKSALGNQELLQSQIEGYENILRSAIENLQLKSETEETEKKELEKMIIIAEKKKEEIYTAESWTGFRTALEIAKTVYADNTSTQKQIDEACEALNSAMKALAEQQPEEKPNKIELKKLVEEAARLVQKEYTEDTWEVFQMALSNAKTVLEDTDAGQETVDKATEELKSAILKLEQAENKKDEQKEEISNNEENQNIESSEEKTNSQNSEKHSNRNSVETGDTLPLTPLFLLASGSCVIVICCIVSSAIKNRRRRK